MRAILRKTLLVAWLACIPLAGLGYVRDREWSALFWLCLAMFWMYAAHDRQRVVAANQELIENISTRWKRSLAFEIALREHAEQCAECPVEHTPSGDRLLVPVGEAEYVTLPTKETP